MATAAYRRAPGSADGAWCMATSLVLQPSVSGETRAARIEQVGRMAEVDPSAGTNPVPYDAQTYSRIFEKALHGRL